MRRHRWLAAGAVVVFAGACGTEPSEQVRSDDDEESPDVEQEQRQVNSSYLAKAADDTLAVDTGRVEMTMAFSGDVDGRPMDFTVSMSGEFDNSVPASHMTMDMAAIFDQLSEMAPESMVADELGGLFGDAPNIETIQVGNTAYVSSAMYGQLITLLGGDADVVEGKWISIDTSNASGGDLANFGGSDMIGQDPTMYLELMAGAGGEVEELGQVDVRGTTTTGYRVEVSVGDALAAQADPESTQELTEGLEQLGAADLEDLDMTMELYVDDDGRVRRVVTTMDFADMATAVPGMEESAAGGAMTMTADYFDFGADGIVIEPPPADDVITVDAMDELFGDLNPLGSIAAGDEDD